MPQITLKSWTSTAVRCLAGSRADERPLSFLLGESEIKVHSVLDNWREPDYLCFRVEAEDGRKYDLRHHEYEDDWQVRESSQRG